MSKLPEPIVPDLFPNETDDFVEQKLIIDSLYRTGVRAIRGYHFTLLLTNIKS
jgi:hypothetical protein